MSFFSRLDAAWSALFAKQTTEDFFRDMAGGYSSATGLAISQGSAINVSTVYACISVRAKDVARCAPRLIHRKGARSQTPIENHSVAKIFERPNDLQTWFEWCLQMQSALLLKGNAYAAIVRDGRGNPISLWPLNPDTVYLYESYGGELFYSVMRSGLYLTHQLRNMPLMIPEEDVFHLRGLSFNSLSGISTISVARDAIGVALGLEQQAARFMANGARPAGVLQTDQKLSTEGRTRVATQWENLRSGIANAGKTAVLEEGLKWNAMQLSSVDLEFIEQRRLSVEEIARFFSVPLHKLGVTGAGGRFARLDQADQSYVNSTIMPDLELWEQKFNQKFGLGSEGLTADFDERQLLRADEATRVSNSRLRVMSGLRTQNEERLIEGDEPIEGADVLLTPVNLAAVGSDLSGTSPDGAGRPEDGDQPDPGAPVPDAPVKEKPKAGDPSLRRVAHYVIDKQSGAVREELTGKRESDVPVATEEDEPK